MATIRKGMSYKGNRIAILSAFDQTGEKQTGKNLQLVMANDLETDDNRVITNPSLVYKSYNDKNGKPQTWTKESYSKKQYEAIMAVANTDGTHPVFEADLMPSANGKNLIVNTNTVKHVDQPFDHEKHKERTLEVRNDRAAAAAAAREAAKAKSTEKAKAKEEDLDPEL